MKKYDRFYKILEIAVAFAAVMTFILSLRTLIATPDSAVGRVLFNYPVTLTIFSCALLSSVAAIFILIRRKQSVLRSEVSLPFYNKRLRDFALVFLGVVPIISLIIGSLALIRETPDMLFPPFKIVGLRNGSSEMCFGVVNSGKSKKITVENIQFDYKAFKWGSRLPSTFILKTDENCTYLDSIKYPVESLTVPLTRILKFARVTEFSRESISIVPGQACYFKINFVSEYPQPVQARMKIRYFDIQRGHVEHVTPFAFWVSRQNL